MFKKIVLIATASLIAISITGCSKKPRRPNPIDTVIGQDYGSGAGRNNADGFNPMDMSGDGALLEGRFEGFNGNMSTEEILAMAERGMFEPVYFQFDSSAIAPQERAKLQNVADFLEANPGAYVVLEGHCDWRGTQEYNLALGDRRAKSALNYLGTLGSQTSHLQPLSQGDLKATEGASSAQMARERKVEILVIR